MENEIVILHHGEPRVSSWNLKDGFGFNDDHRYVVRMIEKYRSDFEEFGVIAIERQKPIGPDGGRPVDAYLLNENQAMFLGTLFRNTFKVIQFKKALVKQFDKQKKLISTMLSQKQNAEWLEARKAGKPIRKIETDVIQRFVDYATNQGSINAKMYYMAISKMENKALFFIEQKYKDIRDILSIHQLGIIGCADTIVANALEDGMKKKMQYKDIYILAKEWIESFAKIHGKTLIPAIEQIQKPKIVQEAQLKLIG